MLWILDLSFIFGTGIECDKQKKLCVPIDKIFSLIYQLPRSTSCSGYRQSWGLPLFYPEQYLFKSNLLISQVELFAEMTAHNSNYIHFKGWKGTQKSLSATTVKIMPNFLRILICKHQSLYLLLSSVPLFSYLTCLSKQRQSLLPFPLLLPIQATKQNTQIYLLSNSDPSTAFLPQCQFFSSGKRSLCSQLGTKWLISLLKGWWHAENSLISVLKGQILETDNSSISTSDKGVCHLFHAYPPQLPP